MWWRRCGRCESAASLPLGRSPISAIGHPEARESALLTRFRSDEQETEWDGGGGRGWVSPASQGEGVLGMQRCTSPGIDASLKIKIICHYPPSCLHLTGNSKWASSASFHFLGFFSLFHVNAGGDWRQSGSEPSERWSAAARQHTPAGG